VPNEKGPPSGRGRTAHLVEDGIWCVVLSKVACLLESRFVADVGKDRRDGILGDDSSSYHIRQNAYRLGACGRGCTPSQTIYPTQSPW
jgi:hypothetical protein